jgi:hypothetical protein
MPEDQVVPKTSARPRYLHIFQVLQKKEKEQMRWGISKNKTTSSRKKNKKIILVLSIHVRTSEKLLFVFQVT